MSRSAQSFVDILQARADQTPDKPVVSWLDVQAMSLDTLSSGALHQRTQSVCAQLQALDLEGGPIFLMYPPGLEFVTAFLGAVTAEVVVCPVPADLSNRALDRLSSGLRSAQPKAIITTAGHLETLERRGVAETIRAQGVRLLTLKLSSPQAARNLKTSRSPHATAVLQFSSGSTGQPKAICVSEASLIANARQIQEVNQLTPEDRVLCWQPPFHDMGLVGGIITPLIAGIEQILMSPADFLRSPLAWLNAMSKFSVTVTTAPNFALDYTVARAAARAEELDLSALRLLFCGAERVSARSVRSFQKAFAPGGLRPDVVAPCYGLAEATLLVAAAPAGAAIRTRAPRHSAVVGPGEPPLVSCGRPHGEQQVVVVRPGESLPAEDGELGEIWIRGPHIAGEYLNETGERLSLICHALPGFGDGFLRTGDLGFLLDGDLYVRGREGEQLNIRGVKYAPEAIEEMIGAIDRDGLLQRQTVLARRGGGGDLSLVWELMPGRRDVILAETFAEEVCDLVGTRLGLSVAEVLVVRSGGIPVTTSGKTRRLLCQQQLDSGTLPLKQLLLSHRSVGGQTASGLHKHTTSHAIAWAAFGEVACRALNLETVDPSYSFFALGGNSLSALHFIEILEKELSLTISLEDLFAAQNLEEIFNTCNPRIDVVTII